MLARVSLMVFVYVTVGTLLAWGAGASVPQPVPETVETWKVGEPTASAPSTSTTTIAWTSARLSDAETFDVVPVALEIPSIEVLAEVVVSGVEEDSGQMEIPARPEQVGWYRFGPRPGEAGSAVLAGHVDMAGQGPGAFFELDRLVAGDEVTVHLSDGNTHRFRVVTTVRVPKADLDVGAIFSRQGGPRLTLVTCGGAFNHTDRSYDDNVVTTLIPLGAPA